MNKTHRSLVALANLASVDLQRRFIVHGTDSVYLLASELLEALGAVEEVCRNPGIGYWTGFTDEERASIEKAVFRIAEMAFTRDSNWSPDNFDGEFLIEQDPTWLKIREEANACLSAIGFDLRQWESEQLEAIATARNARDSAQASS